jgi:hypothetical protein
MVGPSTGAPPQVEDRLGQRGAGPDGAEQEEDPGVEELPQQRRRRAVEEVEVVDEEDVRLVPGPAAEGGRRGAVAGHGIGAGGQRLRR